MPDRSIANRPRNGQEAPCYAGTVQEELTVEVATVQGPIEAEVVRAILESNGIVVLTSTLVPHSVWPLTVDGLGSVRIRVREEEAERWVPRERGGAALMARGPDGYWMVPDPDGDLYDPAWPVMSVTSAVFMGQFFTCFCISLL